MFIDDNNQDIKIESHQSYPLYKKISLNENIVAVGANNIYIREQGVVSLDLVNGFFSGANKIK